MRTGEACPLLGQVLCLGLGLALSAEQVWSQAPSGGKDGRGDAFVLRQHALNHGGDAKGGEKLFQTLRPTSCATCHRVRGQGGDVGPDLSLIGGKFDRAHLVESILEPSRQIVEGYRTTIVALRDGRVGCIDGRRGLSREQVAA